MRNKLAESLHSIPGELLILAGAVLLTLVIVLGQTESDIIFAGFLILFGSLGLIRQIMDMVSGRRRKIDMFSPSVFFPILYSLLYGIGSIVYVRVQNYSLPTVHYRWYFLGLGTYYAGILVAHLVPLSSKTVHTWRRVRLKQSILALFLIGIIGYAIIVARAGLPILASDFETARTTIVGQVGGYVTYLTDSLQIVIMLVFIYVYLYLKSKIPLNYPIWTVILIVAIFLMFTLGARRKLAAPFLVVIFFYHYAIRRIRISLILLFVMVGFLLLIYAGSVRFEESLTVGGDLLGRVAYIEIVRVTDALYRLSDIIPEQFDYFGWKSLLLPVMALAPGEQKLLGLLIKEDLLQSNFRGGGFVPGVLGYFYVAFGPAGIYTGMFIIGALITILYRKMLKQKDALSIALYSYVAVYYIIALRSGFIELWPLFVIVVFLLIEFYSRIRFSLPESVVNNTSLNDGSGQSREERPITGRNLDQND